MRRSAFFVLCAVVACRLDVKLGEEPSLLASAGGGGASPVTSSSGGTGGCLMEPGLDFDGDGFTADGGDCDDCNALVGPGAIEAIAEIGEPIDDDCDGVIDEPPDPPCDDFLLVEELDALAAAFALDVCTLADARWALPDGTEPPPFERELFHLGHGLLPDFGPNVAPRRGAALLALSSGTARRPIDFDFVSPEGFYKGYTSDFPEGVPIESPTCGPVGLGPPNDGIALELTLFTPQNAFGLRYDSFFYTYEWPDFVCSPFDDVFAALLPPFGNVAFDDSGNPISVNTTFLEVCGCEGNPPSPCLVGDREFACGLGDAELVGTGYGFDTDFVNRDHAGTGWLTTRAPVDPNAVAVLRFTIYDSSDGGLDSTVLLDNFGWLTEPTAIGTERAAK